MAKKKHTHYHPVQTKKKVSQSQQEHCYIVAKKMLRFYELDPNLIDSFTKRQKQLTLNTIFEIPSIKPEKENSIPRPFVNEIRTTTLNYMKKTYAGDPENQLTYYELATCGMGFILAVAGFADTGLFTGTLQEESARMVHETILKKEVFKEGFDDVLAHVRFLTRSYSQVNFRLYGFEYSWERGSAKIAGMVAMQMKIRLTVQDCEFKMFTHHNVERKAFRLILTADGLYLPSWAIILKSKIFPKAKKEDFFDIYIQSHVLHRFKERIDLFAPNDRNFLIQYTLTNAQRVITTSGNQKLLACMLYSKYPIGYFTFFIQGDDIVINTFLPLASENTPEGEKLHKLLQLGKEDVIYLGMDKLSFYTQVDFEQIPVLKQALIEAGFWETKAALDNSVDKEALEEGDNPIDENRTRFVKHFFDKQEEHRRSMEEEDRTEIE